MTLEESLQRIRVLDKIQVTTKKLEVLFICLSSFVEISVKTSSFLLPPFQPRSEAITVRI